jgi:basic membrane lipoprotein Med (substrate-binding protein (PBP1-ABC) superfamily)
MSIFKGLIFSVFILLCSSLKVGVLLPGNTSDFGYNYQIWVGIQDFKTEFPNIPIIFTENVKVPDCIATGSSYINDQAVDVIFLPNLPFVACAQNLSRTFPTKFFIVHNAGEVYPDFPNLATEYRGDLGKVRFIFGVLAAKQKDTSKICIMVPKFFPLKERFANYVLLGMRYLNNNDQLHLGYTASFEDPATEHVVVNHFISVGCDITMLQSINSIHPLLELANSTSPWGMGTAADMRDHVGESVLTSVIIDSFVTFKYFVDKVIAGTFTNELFLDTLDNKGLVIADYSCEVTKAARRETNKVIDKILAGTLNPLCQPLIQEIFGTPCATEAQLTGTFFPGITFFDGTVA